MNTPLEHRINEANLTYFVMKLHPEDLYLQFRTYNALNSLTELNGGNYRK